MPEGGASCTPTSEVWLLQNFLSALGPIENLAGQGLHLPQLHLSVLLSPLTSPLRGTLRTGTRRGLGSATPLELGLDVRLLGTAGQPAMKTQEQECEGPLF